MVSRRLLSAIGLSFVLGACSANPAEPVQTPAVDTGPAAAVDEVRSVAGDLEERSQFIDSQMRDPFSPP
jgi:hypothetical protein